MNQFLRDQASDSEEEYWIRNIAKDRKVIPDPIGC